MIRSFLSWRVSARVPSRAFSVVVAGSTCCLLFQSCSAAGPAPTAAPAAAAVEIPRTWDDEQIASLEVPLAQGEHSPHREGSDYYYRIPVRQIFKSYPVYHPDHEPPGYIEHLQSLEPEIAFDATRLHTEDDWIQAGEVVFSVPITYDTLVKIENVRDRSWYGTSRVPVTTDGEVPFFRYFVLEKGTVSLGQFSCATCHTRVMPDGSKIVGAQGNFPLDHLDAVSLARRAERTKDPEALLERYRRSLITPYGAPWLGENDPSAHYNQMSLQDLVALQEAIPPGVHARFGTSTLNPVQIPDLIGVRDRHYLDRTGLMKHRSIGDLMRYAAINQGLFYVDHYSDFTPAGRLLEPETMERYSDEQLYALALYLYSLKPPPNPNAWGPQAARGKEVFEQSGCWRCHTPPLYTSNKLTPVDGFDPGPDHPQSADILPYSVGTDPGLALHTRRGTGFYKVPSLKGVWYRGPFEHSGSVATLEDWFDPRRHDQDYVPTGYRGPLTTTRAVQGHPFGLDLSAEDKAALIAFLRTL
ncbi:MAG TPA: hypothetical protein VF017_10915 [Thermoanaerobaculia bacterium]|nr:hypothetical protein [Thermoanaerobaculia bacterium]